MKKLLFLLGLTGFVSTFLAVPGLHAQSGGPYDLSWFTIDAGGGTSTGGPYSLSGTVGQPDAGSPMTGGQYSLIGGFWGVISAIQSPGAPLLTVTRNSVTGAVTVSWPLPADGFLLDQSSLLTTPPASIPWGLVAFPYQTNATQISVTIPAPAGSRYYRLRKP
jgi:hypothetical protein